MASGSPPTIPRSARLRSLAAANLLGATVSWNLANVGAAAEVTADHFGVPLETVGLFTMLLFVGQLAVMLVGGPIIDRLGPRRLGIACLAVAGIANLLVLTTSSVVVVLALRAVMGACVGFGFVGGTAYVRAVGGSALTQGIYGGITIAGAGAAVATVPALVGPLGWRAPYVSGAAVVLIGIAALLAAPRLPAAAVGRRPRLRAVFSDTRVLRFGAPQAASFGMSVVLGNWVVTLLVRHGDLTPALAGLVGALTLVGGLMGRPLGGMLGDRFPEHKRAVVVGSMLVGGVATLGLAVAQPLPLALASTLVLGIAAGVPFGPMFDAVTRLRSDAPAVAVTAMNTPAVTLLIVGTPLLGLSFSDPTGGRLGFVVAGLLWGATALVVPSRDLFRTAAAPSP